MRYRSTTSIPLSTSTTAPLIPEPPTSTPRYVLDWSVIGALSVANTGGLTDLHAQSFAQSGGPPYREAIPPSGGSMSSPITETREWQDLLAHRSALAPTDLRTLFRREPQRADALHVDAVDLFLDYSKQRLTSETINLLVALAERSGLRAHIDAMFRGDPINVTEHRAALHVALRMPSTDSLIVDGTDVIAESQTVLAKMRVFSDRVRNGVHTGFTGKPIRCRRQHRHRWFRPRTSDGLRRTRRLR